MLLPNSGAQCSAISMHCKGHACSYSVGEQHDIISDFSELSSTSEDEDDLTTEETSTVEEKKEQLELGYEEEFPESARHFRRR